VHERASAQSGRKCEPTHTLNEYSGLHRCDPNQRDGMVEHPLLEGDPPLPLPQVGDGDSRVLRREALGLDEPPRVSATETAVGRIPLDVSPFVGHVSIGGSVLRAGQDPPILTRLIRGGNVNDEYASAALRSALPTVRLGIDASPPSRRP
jgi:hypothetical protein